MEKNLPKYFDTYLHKLPFGIKKDIVSLILYYLADMEKLIIKYEEFDIAGLFR